MDAGLAEGIPFLATEYVTAESLDVAMHLGIPCGGWCPRGRIAEDGPIADRYPLIETGSGFYGKRTKINVAKSDATLILTAHEGVAVSYGTQLTRAAALRLQKSTFVIRLPIQHRSEPGTAKVLGWIDDHNIKILNVAGPRESESPGIYDLSFAFILTILTQLLGDNFNCLTSS